jgi:hypothetical protein
MVIPTASPSRPKGAAAPFARASARPDFQAQNALTVLPLYRPVLPRASNWVGSSERCFRASRLPHLGPRIELLVGDLLESRAAGVPSFEGFFLLLRSLHIGGALAAFAGVLRIGRCQERERGRSNHDKLQSLHCDFPRKSSCARNAKARQLYRSHTVALGLRAIFLLFLAVSNPNSTAVPIPKIKASSPRIKAPLMNSLAAGLGEDNPCLRAAPVDDSPSPAGASRVRAAPLQTTSPFRIRAWLKLDECAIDLELRRGSCATRPLRIMSRVLEASALQLADQGPRR